VPSNLTVLGVGVGDSISADPYASGGGGDDRSWAETAKLYVPEGSIIARGVSGRRVEDWTEARIRTEVQDRMVASQITVAIVMLGVNNLTSAPVDRPFPVLANRLRDLYALLRSFGAYVCACTITPIGFSGATEQARLDTNAWILGQPKNVDCVADTAGVICDAVGNQIHADYRADSLHPNNAGEAVLGQTIGRVVRDFIPTARAGRLDYQSARMDAYVDPLARAVTRR